MLQNDSIYTEYFNKQLKKAIKRHSCIDEDFYALELTVKTNKENTSQTDRIPIGDIPHKVFKTRLFVFELQKKKKEREQKNALLKRYILILVLYLLCFYFI